MKWTLRNFKAFKIENKQQHAFHMVFYLVPNWIWVPIQFQTLGLFLISIAYKTNAKRQLDLVRAGPDRLFKCK